MLLLLLLLLCARRLLLELAVCRFAAVCVLTEEQAVSE
jgi:hypothetical protein